MSIDLIAGIIYEHWETWQDIAFIGGLAALAVLTFVIIAFVILNNAHMEADGRRAAKRIAWYEERIEIERKALEAAEEQAKSELEQKRKELQAKREEAEQAETAAVMARQAAYFQRERLKELYAKVDLTKKELAEYQKREGTSVPEDVAINIVTEQVIGGCAYAMDTQVTDAKIPQGLTANYTVQDITEYISKKPGIEAFAAEGKKVSRFKIKDGGEKGKAFAFVNNNGNGVFTVTFKCGPDYGAKLIKHLKHAVGNAAFPSGLIWFSVSNEKQACPFELIKLLIDISYRIAKLGY